MAQGKSYLTSWRKLRAKNSAVGLNSLTGGSAGAGGGPTVRSLASSDAPRDAITMATLPMTGLPNIRFAKRDVASVLFEGPNAAYMGSLAKLFDAVQILGTSSAAAAAAAAAILFSR